jgi:superfamily II DNA or RNA helicase
VQFAPLVQPVRVDSLGWVPYSKELANRLVFTSKYGDPVDLGIPSPSKEWLGVPRALCTSSGSDHRTVGTPVALKCIKPPRNKEQEKVLEAAKKELDKGHSFIIQATTGFGKTYCAANLIAHMGRTTLVVVTKADLMDQWRKELKNFLGLQDHEIGIAVQDQCDYKGKKVVIGMVHSLAKNKYGSDFLNSFGVVIWDEVHRLGAETFSRTCSLFPAKIRVGLSATVKRNDGKSAVFHAHIGPILVQTSLVQLPPKIIFQRTRFQYRGYYTPSRMMGMYKAMAADVERNALIVDFVCRAYKKGRNVIVFSDLREQHLDPLFWMAQSKGIPSADMAYYVGGMKEKERALAKQKRVLFATYAMTAEATDIPRLDTAVLATPRANVLQPVGRILREYEGKPQPVVYDLVDTSIPLLMGYKSKRQTEYFKLKATILNV